MAVGDLKKMLLVFVNRQTVIGKTDNLSTSDLC